MIIIGKSGNNEYNYEAWVEGELITKRAYGRNPEEALGRLLLANPGYVFGLLSLEDVHGNRTLQKASECIP